MQPLLKFIESEGSQPEKPLNADAAFENDIPKRWANYEDRYVAFVDILGFKDLIAESAENPDKLALIVSALDVGITHSVRSVVLDELQVEADQVDLRMYTFSDFVVVSALPTAAGLSTVLYVIWVLSCRWLSNGILSRGGITRGKLMHRVGEGNGEGGAPMAFGPAFIEAYRLESVTADYPRVVLGKPARNDWEHYKRDGLLGHQLPLLVHRCSDGPSCIDVFCHLRPNGFTLISAENPIEAEQIRSALHGHLDDNAEAPSVHRKTLWLAERFNLSIVDTRYAHLKVHRE